MRENLKWPKWCHPLDQAGLWSANPLYDWQADIINAFAIPGSRVVASTNNGSGKTSTVLPICMMSVMAAFPFARCFVTSGSERQVREQFFEDVIIPLVNPLIPKGWKVTRGDKMKVTAPNGSTLLCYVCKNADNVEGFHERTVMYRGREIYAPTAYALDECKSINDDVHLAVRRIDPDFMVSLSSPGLMDGWFYEGINPDTLRVRGAA